MAIDSGLITSTLSAKALLVLPKALAPLGAFSQDFSAGVGSRKSSVVVQLVSGGITVGVNPTDFESDDADSTGVPVSLDHYVAPFALNSDELQNGILLENKAGAALDALAQRIKTKINTLITTAYTNTVTTVAEASFSTAEAKSLWGSIKSGNKSLILTPAAFANLLPTGLTSFQLDPVDGSLKGAHGYKGIYVDGNNTSIGYTNVYGFAASPEAMAVASRIPDVASRSALIAYEEVLIKSLGMTVIFKVWAKPGANAVRASYEVMFGAARGDVTALSAIRSAAP